MDFKHKLGETYDALCDLEADARGLKNHHLADLLQHGIGKLQMALSHPDIDRVGAEDPDAFAGVRDLKPAAPHDVHAPLPPAPFPGTDTTNQPLPRA